VDALTINRKCLTTLGIRGEEVPEATLDLIARALQHDPFTKGTLKVLQLDHLFRFAARSTGCPLRSTTSRGRDEFLCMNA
jgi:hypothetical protein